MEQTALGTIEISRSAIASLVSNAATQTYGVVGMTSSSRASGLAATITRDPNRGVTVEFDTEGQMLVDVYVIIEYGTNIASVANSLINAVRYHVQTSTGLAVKQVNIHIQGLRVSSTDAVF